MTALPGRLPAPARRADCCRQGAEPARRLAPRTVLPVHYDDCTVMRSPPSAFLAEIEAVGLGERLVHCPHGGHARITVPRGAAPSS
ncbi:hypothetical protein ACWC24_23365 [Streptomyces sp. NPDC001443]